MEFDPELVDAFTRMIRDWEQRRMPMNGQPAPDAPPPPGPAGTPAGVSAPRT
jgi:hypothetical protein